jgi:hypothetical protein
VGIASLFGADERPNELPSHPQTAFFLGCVFQRLGGFFSIGSNGCRYMGKPEPVAFRMQAHEAGEEDPTLHIPQLPDAEPHERFHCAEEWRGAIKLVDALIRRMSKEDKDFLFMAMAAEAVDERGFKPSIEDPKRPATDIHMAAALEWLKRNDPRFGGEA